jgi:hypothetical protein
MRSDSRASRRLYVAIFLLALVLAAGYAALISQPGYTDAYYYYNGGVRLAEGDGLTDPYLWMYLNAPDKLPGPSHTYWMPLESLLVAASTTVFGVGFGAAQVASTLCFAGLVTLAAWVGWRIGGTQRHMVIGALLVLFSGYFTPYWTGTDTFALYGLVGAGALAAVGQGRGSGSWRWFALAGALSALGHLTRADGLLLLLVTLLVAMWPSASISPAQRGRNAAIALGAYAIVMLPWFVRNLSVIDSPLPVGGMQTVWLRGYEDLVNYPPGVTFSDFLHWGIWNIFQSRWVAFQNNVGTFVAVETWIVLGPFALLGLWTRRHHPMVPGVALYALGLHLAMTFVFAYPGYRGGLFHSSAALLPFWAAFGLAGLDDAIAWMAVHRGWKKRQAQRVFSTALVVLAVALSLGLLFGRRSGWNTADELYATIGSDLPPDAVVMINDPPSLYYHTGLSGVVLPNSDPDVVPEIAARYGVTHLVLDINRTQPFAALFEGQDRRSFLREIRVYDRGTADPDDDLRLFEIVSTVEN